MIRLELPWPPSLWTLYFIRAIKFKTVWCLSKRGKIYRDDVVTLTCQQLGGRPKPLIGPVGVSIDYHPDKRTANRIWDLDNRFKILLDSLTHARIYSDDHQIHDLHARKRPMVPGGLVVVEAREL